MGELRYISVQLMRNLHPIHVAVNLCLIIALAIQPVAACFGGAGEASNCVEAEPDLFTCGGCGSCDVESDTKRCRGSDELRFKTRVADRTDKPIAKSIEPIDG